MYENISDLKNHLNKISHQILQFKELLLQNYMTLKSMFLFKYYVEYTFIQNKSLVLLFESVCNKYNIVIKINEF